MEYHELRTELDDGRVLEVATMGNPRGLTVLFHHGTPGSVKTLELFSPLLERGDFRLITMSRPGYGASSSREGRVVASVVEDAASVLHHFGGDMYVSMGWSGGGPHALACAALDERCLGVVAIASVVPLDVDFDWTEGMGPENLEEFALAKEGGPAYEEAMQAVGAFLAEANKDNIVDLMGGLLSDPDRAVLADDDFRERFAASTRYGFDQTWRGYYEDNVAFYSPWGFDPTSITLPIDLFYGGADLSVPMTHGAWLSSHLQSPRTHLYQEDGHFSIYANHFDELAAALSSMV